ncbi:MAG: HEAT repeat domain-containing protein, partial [Verrucomicrobiae bacterium]|nr:HEAT repeat domain-containing protein [Verrucomicrobiae bacterium]
YLMRLADAMDRIEPGSRVHVIPGAVLGLASSDERVRAKSAELLGRIGPPAASAAPQLRELLGDPWRMVREAAAQALESIEGR